MSHFTHTDPTFLYVPPRATTDCIDVSGYWPPVTVARALKELSAEQLVELQSLIPAELAGRLSQLEKAAENANRALEAARKVAGK